MRFDQPDEIRPRAPYLNQGFQMRMLAMVVALGLVIFSIRTASNPAFWARWFPDPPSEDAPPARSKPEPTPLPTAQPDLKYGEIRVADSDPETPPADEANEPPLVAPRPVERIVESNLPELGERPETVPVEINRDLLLPVQDDTVNLRAAEIEPFYTLLDYAVRVPLDELHAAGHDDVSREVLLTVPENYRGIPVTITGHLRRNVVLPAQNNLFGITQYFDGWIIVAHSANIPWRVSALEIDGSLPVAEAVSDVVPVRITGYFFKTHGYQSKDGLKMTPWLVARKIEAAPAPPIVPIENGEYVTKWIFWGFCGLFAVAGLAVWISTRGDRQSRDVRRETLESGGDLSAIQGSESFDPGRDLQSMADQGERS